MYNFKKKNELKKIYIYIIVSLIVSLFIQTVILPNKNSVYNKMEFETINGNLDISSYSINGNVFTAQNNDPQLLFTDVNSNISAIEINFLKSIQQDLNIQVYYSKNNENLSEENSIAYKVEKGKEKLIIEVPYSNYSSIRIDIGNKTGETFELNDIRICNYKITVFNKFISRIKIVNLLIIAVSIFLLLNMNEKYINKIFCKKNKTLEYIFIIFSFLMFLLWAIVQPFNSCPDEFMRYDVIKYLFNYNRLPHGGDPLIRNEIWGFSYAFLPYLSGIISAIFMKIVSIISSNEQVLMLAARMASVCFGTLTVWYVIRIANKLFKNEYKWLFIILASCLPQFIFLGSYMNNDILALLSVAMMIYYWIDGHEKNWNIKTNIGLAIGVSISLLSYYNVYPFILFSIVFFIWSNITNKTEKSDILKKFITVTIIVFALSGWWFIRNMILYNGDFLGLSTLTEYSNRYAMDEIKPINRITPLKQNVSLCYMMIDMKWIQSTYLSFIGCFGYMSIPMHKYMYNIVSIIISIGSFGFMVKVFKLKKYKLESVFIYLLMALSSILTIILSIYHSYTAGFQAQGRYIMGCLIPLMIFVTIGFKYILESIKNKYKIDTKKIIIVICIFWILVAIMCFKQIILPTYL